MLKEKDFPKKRSLVILIFIVMLSPLVARSFVFSSTYANPFYRILEFMIGMILAECWISGERISQGKNGRKLVVGNIILILGITFLCKIGFGNYSNQEFFTVPLFCFIIFQAAGIENSFFEKIMQTKIMRFLNAISYAIFIAQFLTWEIVLLIDDRLNIKPMYVNWFNISCSLVITIINASLLHMLIEVPIKNLYLQIQRERKGL